MTAKEILGRLINTYDQRHFALQRAPRGYFYYVPGGEDIWPGLYNQTPHPTTTTKNPVYDIREAILIRSIIDRGDPLIAICRGHQMVHAATGGCLAQDLSLLEVGFGHYTHLVGSVDPESKLYDAVRVDYIPVNHTHHQAVIEVGKGFKPVVVVDGIVEFAEHETKPVFTMQFHPEFTDYPAYEWFVPTIFEYLKEVWLCQSK